MSVLTFLGGGLPRPLLPPLTPLLAGPGGTTAITMYTNIGYNNSPVNKGLAWPGHLHQFWLGMLELVSEKDGKGLVQKKDSLIYYK